MATTSPTSLRSAALVVAPFTAVAVGVFADGGYGPAGRVGFGVAALLALAVSLLAHGRPPARNPTVLVLIGLAVLGGLSALWTIGPVGLTLQWALVCAGYAAVALAAGAAARAHGAGVLAGGIAAVAIAAAAVGLLAAAAFEAPYANRVAGVWRPGGPFEYAPALALLQVSALPALLAGMAHRSRALAAVAAGGMALAGGVLALSASRSALAMAVVVAGAALARPDVTVRAPRTTVAASLVLGAAAGIALVVMAGGSVPPAAHVQPLRVAGVLAVVVVAAVLWPVVRDAARRLPAWGPRTGRPPDAGMAIGLLAVAAVAGALAFGSAPGRGDGPPTDFLHGRADTWRAAVATWSDRPITGTGAGAFLTGSARHQNGATVRFAHDLPLDLAAELGVAGLALAFALYAAAAGSLWRVRGTPAAWLLGPATVAFLAANVVDWPWHLAGAGAVWALAVGGLADRDQNADGE